MSLIKGARNPEAAKKFIDFALSPAAQDINVKLKINSLPSNTQSAVSPEAPKFSEIKLIDYDTAKFGQPGERTRLLGRFEKEVKTQPR